LISSPLEHFQAKWEPVRRPEMRQNKEIERFHDSTQHESALSGQSQKAKGRRNAGLFVFANESKPAFAFAQRLACQPKPAASAGEGWSGRRESNPRMQLGKLLWRVLFQ
jgi:hypothetical protein